MTDKIFPARLEQVIEEMSALFGDRVDGLLPARARRHLVAAQRELFLAVTTTIDHHAGRREKRTPAKAARGTGRAKGGAGIPRGTGRKAAETGATTPTATKRPRRVKLD